VTGGLIVVAMNGGESAVKSVMAAIVDQPDEREPPATARAAQRDAEKRG
jgi:hypothetical protein